MSNKRPFVNCAKVKMWKMTNEDAGTYAGSVTLDFEKRMTTYTDSIQTNSTPLYGDGELVEVAVSEGLGTLSIGVHHVTDGERVDLYGENNVDGVTVNTGDSVPPYFCVALMNKKRNGMVNLRKWFKVSFAPHEETVNQMEDNGIQYSMPTLKGTYSKNIPLGMKSARVEVDPSTTEGASIIASWFSIADYIGSSSLVNTSTFKNGTADVAEGAQITEGTTLTLTGAATGGTSPYKYDFVYKADSSNYWTVIAEDTSTASQSLTLPTVAADTAYTIKIVVRDNAGTVREKSVGITVKDGE